MPVQTSRLPREWSLDDLLRHLGGIPASRVRLNPAPGTAVEDDVLALMRQDRRRLCELVDGVLVEKAMGYRESKLALWIGHLLQHFLEENDIGDVAGADGAMRLMPGLVRIPDVSFVRHDQVKDPGVLDEALPDLHPDLAVEVLSAGNTEEEMERKLKEYFFSGAGLVWLVDPSTRTVKACTAPDQCVTLNETGTLDGGEVLPGFSLPVARVFAKMRKPPQQGRKGRGKKK